jgi:hypothetical protein
VHDFITPLENESRSSHPKIAAQYQILPVAEARMISSNGGAAILLLSLGIG